MADFTAKYRPQKISELDLVFAREQIENIFKSGKIPHAFLFSGPRGIGKTSAARILAKAVNCTGKEEKDFEPCNKCDQCLSITNGSNMDVLEIDAASNRGIDDIRELREKIRLAPTGSKYKVYIIDEVHMLTPEAFNALLKTLEEPPSHAIFILCTTSPEKLPETIISRCFRLNFKRATQGEIVQKLRRIAESEKIDYDEFGLNEIARAVSGSFRDATKIFEQISLSGKKVDSENVKEILGQLVGYEPSRLLECLVEKDAEKSLNEIGRVVSAGVNLRSYADQLLDILHTLLLSKFGVIQEDRGVGQYAFNTDQIRILLELFSKASVGIKDSVIPQLPLEMAVVEWCEQNSKLKTQNSKVVEETKTIEKPVEEKKIEEKKTEKVERSEPSFVGNSTVNITAEEINKKWQQFMLAVRPMNHSVEGLLRSSRPTGIENGVMILEVFYQFHKDKLETEKCRSIVENALKEVFGEPIILRCVLRPKKNLEEKLITSSIPVEDDAAIKAAEEIFAGNAK